MKKITLGCVFLLCMLTSIGMMAQTMNFGFGPAEPGFSFTNWGNATPGAINQANLANPSTITRTEPGTWNATSFSVGPFTGNNTITVTSDQGDSQTFNSGSVQTINLVGFDNITTLTFTRTAGSGASADYDNLTFSVNPVADTTPPTITCPSNIIQANDPGNCSANVTFMATATDDSGTATITYSQDPGTDFPVGTTTVTATATDPSGNSSSCMFDVTINDTEDPVFNCQDISVQLDASGNATVNLGDLVGTITTNTLNIQSTGGDNTSSGNTDFTVPVTADTVITFDWTFNTQDGPSWDPFGYLLNGVFTQLTNDVGTQNQSGSTTVNVMSGDTFGFRSNTVDGCCGEATSIVSNFSPGFVGQFDPSNWTLMTTTNGTAGFITVTTEVPDITDNCGVASSSIDMSNFDCSNVGPNTVTVTVTDVNGNTAMCTSTVTVEDNVAPTAVCQNITVQLDANGMANITPIQVDGGSSDACGIADRSVDIMNFDCTNVGPNNVVLTVTDNNGNTASCTAIVTVEDNVAPTAVCQNITVQLDANGMASITPIQVDGGSSDACGIADRSIDVMNFDCTNVGPNNVVLTVTDNNGNTASCTAVVTVEDNVAPTAVCQNITVQLDANGMASITPAQVDGGSSDACGIADRSVDVMNFDCTNVGPNNVVLTVTDNNGNTASCTAVVIVEDNVAPTAVCQNITVQLDASGMASITPIQVDGGSSDACGIADRSIDVMNFDCTNVGPNNVVLTVTDNNGNTASCTAVVTVEDNVAPTAVCQNITVQLDANGMASITPIQVDGGSSDACGIADRSIDVMNFDCTNVGPNDVVLTVTDNNGNTASCTAVVTVEDNVAPTAVCQNITVQLDANGMASITPAQVDGGSSDACGIANLSIDVMDFDCTDVGPNNVVLTVTDNNGNTASCTAVVTVEDSTTPAIFCSADITAMTEPGMCTSAVFFADAIATDNCGIATIIQTGGLPSGSDFPVGVSTIEYTATDDNGNTSTCTFEITVIDDELPMAVCQDITITLDEFGAASIIASDVDGGSTDNCGVDSISIDMDTFDCSNVGANNVTLTVTDVNGNENTCIAVVTVQDETLPVVACMDLTIQLDATGMATINGEDIDNGSTDACGIASYDLDIDTFDCSNVGENTVTLTVTDANGNSDSCTAIVTVEDNIAPTVVCSTVDIVLDENGFASITAYDISDISDNCTIATTAIDISEFSCADIGTPVTVQVFASDASGNVTTCMSVVNVIDTMGPELICPDNQIVETDPVTYTYTFPDYFATGEAFAGNDNCTDDMNIVTTQDPAPGTVMGVTPNDPVTVTLTATDESGNTVTCSFEVDIKVLGVADNTISLSDLVLYPNPATDYIILNNPQAIALKNAAIYDLNGKLVKSIQLETMGTEKTVDISELQSASYIFVIQGQGQTISRSFIKQ